MFGFNKLKTAALTAALALGLTACASAGNASAAETVTTAADDPDRLKIVCTIFPEYDWTREILGDKADSADITYLLEKGFDLHSYQPTADDIIKISQCDIFIYVGGESDEWVEDALSEAVNKDMTVISLLDTVNAKEEELKEGMQGEEEEAGEEEPEYDEHVWLSLKNAGTICGRITDAVCEKDPANAESYRANLSAYTEKLGALDADLAAFAESLPENRKTLIFGDRFPFRYFTDDYGFDYYAAFIGCSADSEASFETVTFLAGKADELGADTIFTIENSDGEIADSIISCTASKAQKKVMLNSIQSVSGEQTADTTYLGIMRSNYETLKEALS